MRKFFKGLIITVLVLATITVGGIYLLVSDIARSIEKINNDEIVTVDPDMEDFETDEEQPSEGSAVKPESITIKSVAPIEADNLINILLVGQDRQPGQGRQRSDTMILCSYNPDTNEVSLVSFLRDLYVSIPGGYSDNRLNAAYAFGGFPLLYKTLEQNFGVKIDGGIEVDFNGFTELIDLIGGVDIYLTAKEAPYVATSCTEGMNHLNGRKALNYARIRKIDSDFGRTNRQRTLILAVFEKLRHSDRATLMSLMDKAMTMVTTDMTSSSITHLVTTILPKIATVKINTYAVPFDGSYKSTYVRGMAVLVPDNEVIRDKLASEYLPI